MKNNFSIRQPISDKIILSRRLLFTPHCAVNNNTRNTSRMNSNSRRFCPLSAVSNVILHNVLPGKKAGNGTLFLMPYPALIRRQNSAALYHKLFGAPCSGRPLMLISPYIFVQLLVLHSDFHPLRNLGSDSLCVQTVFPEKVLSGA